MKFPKFVRITTTQTASSLIEETENGTIVTGIDITFLNLLAEKLKFQYKIILPKDDGRWGIQDEHGHWSGVTGMLERGDADFCPLYSPVIEERMPVLDYSTSYYTLEKTFATDFPHPLPRYSVLLLPYQTDVWIAILVTILLVPGVLQQLMFGEYSGLKFLINMFMCKKMSPRIRNSLKRRFLYGSWLVFETIVRFVYTSVVLSFLAVQPMPKGIENIPELAAAVRKGEFRFYVPSGSLNAEFLMHSELEDFRTIGFAIKRNNWFEALDYKDEKVGESKAIEGARAILHVMYGKPPFSTVSIAEDSFGIWSAAIMLRKGFCCKEALDTVILRISNGGLYQKIIDDEAYRQQMKLFSRKSRGGEVKKLGLEELSGIFFLLVLSYILSFFILFVECMYNRWTVSKGKRI
ncbi:lig_chan-Glu_bd domain-containing protein [Trichonephila inaurata madagascariensis]|uniref:Lig_chan-Glu_bd domain-containing protein n=1 Tax=Trichonephila inaurata madagascariensis TaxID=2747483 RepID=A0A8X6Y6A1_9ARAC|nr:lig_chan-Glu_bd domain-containing protein [Trichonephila inaurata madagascariensis]